MLSLWGGAVADLESRGLWAVNYSFILWRTIRLKYGGQLKAL